MSVNLVPVPIPGTDRRIMAVANAGKPMVSLRHACDAIGIAVQSQLAKLRTKSWACVTMTVTHDSSGREQELAMVDRRTFTMWLATIDANRVSPDARPIIETFQAEAADALDAYFNDGGAINPSATTDQLEVLARRAKNQMEVLRLAQGIVDSKHLEAKARIVIASALGEKPEIAPADVPLYVWDYLRAKGLSDDLVEAKAGGFGTRLRGLYEAEHGRRPSKDLQTLRDGRVREVNAYTRSDIHLFDETWNRWYEGVTKARGNGPRAGLGSRRASSGGAA